MKLTNILFIILIIFSTDAFSETLKLKYFQTDLRYSYRIDLLKLAMEKTIESDGQYSLEPAENEMTQSRGILFLKKGENINIGFFPSNKERESTFLSVKIPILRGLLGYRVSLIRKDSLA